MKVKTYLYAGPEMIGEVVDGVQYDYLSDLLGSTTHVVDQSQTIVKTLRNKPYGEILSRSGSIPDPAYQWVAKWNYRMTTLNRASHYMVARHYDFSKGGWTSVDPIWPQEAALSYVNGRATGWVDPGGTLALHFNAFIHQKLGKKGYGGYYWIPTPVQLFVPDLDYTFLGSYFAGDGREFFQNGTSRSASQITVDTTALGNLAVGKFNGGSTAGESHQLERWRSNWTGGIAELMETRTTKFNRNYYTVQNTGTCSSEICFVVSAAYPFPLFGVIPAPPIVYTACFLLTASQRGSCKKPEYVVGVSLSGKHTKFPFFEAYVDPGKIHAYKYSPRDTGPSIGNLGDGNQIPFSGSAGFITAPIPSWCKKKCCE